MNLTITSFPTTSAVGSLELARLKTFLRIENDEEDLDLKDYYLAAASMFESITGRGVFTTSRRLALECLPETAGLDGFLVALPYPKLLTVASVKYYDDDDTEQTLNSQYYVTQTAGEIGRVTLLPDGITAMGDLSIHVAYPISINYTSGYGADTTYLPLGVKNWLRECTKWIYNVKGRESAEGIPAYLRHLAGLWKLGEMW